RARGLDLDAPDGRRRERALSPARARPARRARAHRPGDPLALSPLRPPSGSRVNEMTKDDGLRRLRLLALVEGSSLLVLVGVAVPLKHLFDLPVAVKVLGPLHGIAFLAYVVALIDALGTRGLTGRRAGVALLAAVI